MAPPTSPARLAANRANAQRSTGPRTVEGKAASSRNATKHGLLSPQPLLAEEDPAEYHQVGDSLVQNLSPDGAVEELLVDDIVGIVWRLRRLRRVESALYSIGLSSPLLVALKQAGEADAGVGAAFAAQAANFAALSRYEVALANRLRRSLTDLDVIHEDVVDKREPREVRCGYPAHTTREALMAHRRARLTVFGRQLLVDRIETDGWTIAHAAAAAGVSRQTATKWVRRYRESGPDGLEDRSSRPHRSPRSLPRETVEAILVTRHELGVGPHPRRSCGLAGRSTRTTAARSPRPCVQCPARLREGR